MLKCRLIPKLQMKSVKFGSTSRMVLVTTIQFNKTVEVGDPVSQAKIYEAQAADELVFLDLDATKEGRSTDTAVIKRAAESVFMPLTVGGGVRTLDDFRRLLSCGADKVSINSAAVKNPQIINDASEKFGAQCVVLSIDYRTISGQSRVYTAGGTCEADIDPVAWAMEGERRGAGEIMLTSIDRDGTRQGLDLAMLTKVSQSVSIPVIAGGGCGQAAHFVDGYLKTGVRAISAGTYFCFQDQNPMQTRAHIFNAGVPIRLHRGIQGR